MCAKVKIVYSETVLHFNLNTTLVGEIIQISSGLITQQQPPHAPFQNNNVGHNRPYVPPSIQQ
ncbi:hypothetical protein Lal_00022793 [Lupinus albus]|nr:hypothetical protein Lal_00022793 [Lupinus albus]